MRTETWKKRMVAIVLAVVMVMGVAVVPVSTSYTTVEAASKDKKKTKITFSGKSKITAYKNKSIKIPKTTAKDNKDGNVTKKIKVTVKKGKKSYKSIANKIKNNKSVKFTSTGKYVITYTVTDKAGNKATKKRYVTVKNQPKKAATTEEKTETQTTEATTEKPTTEEPKPETPTVTPTDYSKYDINEVTFNNIKYKVTSDEDFVDIIAISDPNSTKVNFSIDNDYKTFYINREEEILRNSEYLKFLGSIKATDENGNDISDRIVIYEGGIKEAINDVSYDYTSVPIYVEDSNGNKISTHFVIEFCDFDVEYQDCLDKGYTLLSYDPIVFAKPRVKTTSLSNVSSQAKKLELTY